MNNKLQKSQKEAVMTYFEKISAAPYLLDLRKAKRHVSE
jgi:hypothetical protein